jgi:MFS family permease
MARHPVVRTVTIAIGLAHFTFGLAMVADPALADSFDVGSFGYAILYTGWGSVALVGAWFAGRAFRHRGAPYGVITGLALMAGACAMIAVLPAFWAVAVFGSLGGLGSGMVFPLTTGLIQEHTADGVRARVFGAIDTVDKTVFGIGMLAGAPLVSVFGGQGAYGFTAALIGVAALLSLGLPRAVSSTAIAQLEVDQSPEATDGGSPPRPVARSA